MIVAGMQLSRRQRRAGLLVEAQKLDDVADDLGSAEAVAARADRHGTRSEPPQLLQAALIRQHIDRLELDPTDREVFLNPEAARSMRLPKHLDRFVHPSPLGICSAILGWDFWLCNSGRPGPILRPNSHPNGGSDDGCAGSGAGHEARLGGK